MSHHPTLNENRLNISDPTDKQIQALLTEYCLVFNSNISYLVKPVFKTAKLG